MVAQHMVLEGMNCGSRAWTVKRKIRLERGLAGVTVAFFTKSVRSSRNGDDNFER